MAPLMQCMASINLNQPAEVQAAGREQIRVADPVPNSILLRRKRCLNQRRLTQATHELRGPWACVVTRLRAIRTLCTLSDSLSLLRPPFLLCCFVKTFACISIYVHGIKFSAPSKWVTRNGTDCAANKHKLSLFPLLLLFVIFTRAPKRMHAIFSFVAQSPSPFCTCPSDCMCVLVCVCTCVHLCACAANCGLFAFNICPWYFPVAPYKFCTFYSVARQQKQSSGTLQQTSHARHLCEKFSAVLQVLMFVIQPDCVSAVDKVNMN